MVPKVGLAYYIRPVLGLIAQAPLHSLFLQSCKNALPLGRAVRSLQIPPSLKQKNPN